MTPDTVLKWIKSGRLRAHRTAGGHYRIDRHHLHHLAPGSEPAKQGARHYQYCWEFNAHSGVIEARCRECVVYRTRAYRCYEILRLLPEVHQQMFCNKTCDACDYYRNVHLQPTNVLVVSDNQVLTAALERDAPRLSINLKVTECEYTSSALVETFRPDYTIIDCSMGPERSSDLVKHLNVDPRLPYVRIILAGNRGGFPTDCDKEVFARIETPFDINDIAECIEGVQEGSGLQADELAGEGTNPEVK